MGKWVSSHQKIKLKFSIFAGLMLLCSSTSINGSSMDPVELSILNSKTRCIKPAPTESFLRTSDFIHQLTPQQIAPLYESIYHSEKRLKGRIYFDRDQNQFIAKARSGQMIVPERFISLLIRHVEQALKIRAESVPVAEYIFFGDMGHGHIYVSENWYKKHKGLDE